MEPQANFFRKSSIIACKKHKIKGAAKPQTGLLWPGPFISDQARPVLISNTYIRTV